MKSQIETEPGLKKNLLEDVFKLMDAHAIIYQGAVERAEKHGWSLRESPDILVSEVYNALTKRKGGWHRTFSDVDVRTYTFRGNWMKPAKAVFETLLEELGFELYQAKGRAYRIRTIPNEPEEGESDVA